MFRLFGVESVILLFEVYCGLVLNDVWELGEGGGRLGFRGRVLGLVEVMDC